MKKSTTKRIRRLEKKIRKAHSKNKYSRDYTTAAHKYQNFTHGQKIVKEKRLKVMIVCALLCDTGRTEKYVLYWEIQKGKYKGQVIYSVHDAFNEVSESFMDDLGWNGRVSGLRKLVGSKHLVLYHDLHHPKKQLEKYPQFRVGYVITDEVFIY